MTLAQLALNLGHRPAQGREDFLVADSNAEAVDWIDRWRDWPGGVLVLAGPPASGKTHLAAVWQAMTGAVRLTPDAVPADDPLSAAGDPVRCVLDDADTATADVALFHLYNALRSRNGSLLVLAQLPPSRWDGRLPDLVSRLKAATTVTIEPPGDELLYALLVKLFADRQLRVGAEVIEYMFKRMERSCAAARRLVEEIDATALAQRRDVTLPLVREVLGRDAEPA